MQGGAEVAGYHRSALTDLPTGGLVSPAVKHWRWIAINRVLGSFIAVLFNTFQTWPHFTKHPNSDGLTKTDNKRKRGTKWNDLLGLVSNENNWYDPDIQCFQVLPCTECVQRSVVPLGFSSLSGPVPLGQAPFSHSWRVS